MKEANKCPIVLLIFYFCFLGCATGNNSVQDGTPVQIQREKRFYEEAGGFSIIPPESWQAKKVPDLEYRVLIKKDERGGTSNVIFATEMFNGPLNLYEDYALASLNNMFGGNISSIQRNDFVTLKNVRGRKTIANITIHGEDFRQFMYYLPGKEGVFMLISCTVSAETSYDYYNEMFDRMAETFEWKDSYDNTAQEEKRFYEEAGGFSITPPESWQIEKLPGFEYRGLRKQSQFVVFVPETFNRQLDEHVDFILKLLNNTHGENFSLIQRSNFVTLKNIRGEKIIIDISIDGQMIRYFNYFLPGKKNVLMVITCNANVETSHIYNELFDKTVETFEWTDGKDR